MDGGSKLKLSGNPKDSKPSATEGRGRREEHGGGGGGFGNAQGNGITSNWQLTGVPHESGDILPLHSEA